MYEKLLDSTNRIKLGKIAISKLKYSIKIIQQKLKDEKQHTSLQQVSNAKICTIQSLEKQNILTYQQNIIAQIALRWTFVNITYG